MNLFLKSIKINFKMSKKFENKFSVHIRAFYVCTQVFEKNRTFYMACVKDKKMSCE
jgi:hypothetical protein